MTARIYRPAKTAMQSGQARTKEWVLEYEAEAPHGSMKRKSRTTW